MGDVSLKQVVGTLDQERSSVEDTLKRLQGVQVKYAAHANKKPKYMRMRNPLINQDTFYALLQKLPASNEHEEAIMVSSQSQQLESEASQAGDENARLGQKRWNV